MDVCLPEWLLRDPDLDALEAALRRRGRGYRVERRVWPTISRVYDAAGHFVDLCPRRRGAPAPPRPHHVRLSADDDTVVGATGPLRAAHRTLRDGPRTRPNSDIPRNLVMPVQSWQWAKGDGVCISIPARVHDTLVWRYGADYMTPRRGFKGRDA